jgi:hypothetical protein
VQPGALKKTEGHAANFVLVHSAIRVELDAQDQLGGDGLGAGRNLTHFVHALVHKRGQLLVDGGTSFATEESREPPWPISGCGVISGEVSNMIRVGLDGGLEGFDE